MSTVVSDPILKGHNAVATIVAFYGDALKEERAARDSAEALVKKLAEQFAELSRSSYKEKEDARSRADALSTLHDSVCTEATKLRGQVADQAAELVSLRAAYAQLKENA